MNNLRTYSLFSFLIQLPFIFTQHSPLQLTSHPKKKLTTTNKQLPSWLLVMFNSMHNILRRREVVSHHEKEEFLNKEKEN
jgi:hypothetical protein